MNSGGGLPVRNPSKAPSSRMLTVRADALKMPDGTPLKNIEQHCAQDVLCGRGGGTNHHVGNAHWRKLVNSNKRLYLSLPKKQKALVAKSIVHAIRAQNPPGRFLARDPANSLWSDIGDQKATEKTSQALREGAPDIRTEMAREGQIGSGAMTGQILKNGLIGLVECKPGDTLPADTGEDSAFSDSEEVPAANPKAPSPQRGVLPTNRQREDPSMMMAFRQYLGGKNPNPPLAAQTKPIISESNIQAKPQSLQSSILQQQNQHHQQQQQQQHHHHHQQQQQQQPFSSLRSRQLLQSGLGFDSIYPQTALSRKLSGHSTGPLLDLQLMKTNPQHVNFNSREQVITYNDLSQKSDLSSGTGLQMTNQPTSAMRYSSGSMTSSLNDYGALGGRSRLMMDMLQNSSISPASAAGRTNYPRNNYFANPMVGDTSNIGTGNNFISPQVESNTLARLLQHQKSQLSNPLRLTTHQLDPSNLYRMSSLGQLSHPALRSENSIGGQISNPDQASDFGQYLGNGRMGSAPLQPNVSAAMAQMKFELLMKKNMQGAHAHHLNPFVTQQLKSSEAPHVNPLANQQLNSSETPNVNPLATQQLNSTRNDVEVSIPPTSAPKRGVSASLDDLCRAAGLQDYQRAGKHSDVPKDEDVDSGDKLVEKSVHDLMKAKVILSRETEVNAIPSTAPKLGVNDSSLVDDDSDDEYLTAKRKRAEPNNISVEENSKRGKLETAGIEDANLDRPVPKSEGQKDVYFSSSKPSLNRIGNSNFTQKLKTLPLAEATLDRGHSLAMSEISLERGPSLSGIGFMGDGNDGQFDDASEDEVEAPAKTRKVVRGCTLGTINTFPLDMNI